MLRRRNRRRSSALKRFDYHDLVTVSFIVPAVAALTASSTRPAASVGAATNVHVAVGTRAQVVGVTVTDATGAGVVPPPGVVGVPLLPSPLAQADSPKARAATKTAGTGTTGSRITVGE